MWKALALPCLLGVAITGCSGVGANVRTRAASDFACTTDRVHIVDQYESVYRVAACGTVATYRCGDVPFLAANCHRIVWDKPEVHEVTVVTRAGSYSITPTARAQ